MVEKMTLSVRVRDEIERWKQRFPEGRQQSAVIAALHAARGISKRLLQAAHLIRGFSQMPGRHSLAHAGA
jgi:NADH:ubiquinone oxidoreductase subunit E